jgi:hypothetical protein
MKKEMVFFLVISSVSMMSIAMNNSDKNGLAPKEIKQTPVCCPRTFAVPPCEKCIEKLCVRYLERKPAHIPLPLSLSQERERARLPK